MAWLATPASPLLHSSHARCDCRRASDVFPIGIDLSLCHTVWGTDELETGKEYDQPLVQGRAGGAAGQIPN